MTQIDELIEKIKTEYPDNTVALESLMQAKYIVVELEIQLTAITRDRDEWKLATLDANKSIDTSHKKYKKMYARIKNLTEALQIIAGGEPIGNQGFVRLLDGDIRLHWHCEKQYREHEKEHDNPN